jgi:signal peptidase II
MNASTQPRGRLIWLCLTVAAIALDQWSKHAIERHLPMSGIYSLLPVLEFTRLHNPGAAFSFLAGASGWQRWFFTGLACLVSVALIVWLARLERRANLVAAAIALIIAGALGNVIDRVRFGYVVDFIQVHWHAAYFPAFNVADSSITVGAALLLIDAFFSGRHPGSTGA